MAGYVAQPFFMQLVLQQIAAQVVHKIANCDLKVAYCSFIMIQEVYTINVQI